MLIRGPHAKHGVDGELRSELRSFGGSLPKILQGLHPVVKARRGHVRRRIEGQFDVVEFDDSVVEKEGTRSLRVPRGSRVGQGQEGTTTFGLDPIVVRQLSKGGWDDLVGGRIDGDIDHVLGHAIPSTPPNVDVPDHLARDLVVQEAADLGRLGGFDEGLVGLFGELAQHAVLVLYSGHVLLVGLRPVTVLAN